MRPVVYSASSVGSYQDCHLRWYLTYVAGEEGVQSEPQAVGIAVHDYAERRLRGEPVITAIADFIPVASCAMVFDHDILPTYRNPVLIEAEFQLEVNGIPFSGIIDSVDEQDVPWGVSLILRDLKTTGSRPKAGKYRFAMTGYWLGATDLGFEPHAAQLDYIVRTKTPYYWPEAMDPITEDDINIFAATLERTAEGVESGDFEPTGLGTYVCNYCEHKNICGPYQRYTNISPLRQEVNNV